MTILNQDHSSASILFIGTGRIGSALLRGGIASGQLNPAQVLLASKTGESACRLAQEFGCSFASNLEEALQVANIIFLCVKPQVIPELLEPLKEAFAGKLLISVATGTSFERFKKILGDDVRLVRAMPNTGVGILKGVTSLSWKEELPESDRHFVTAFFNGLGKSFEIEENNMDVATVLGGSGPAFAFFFLEALIDGVAPLGMDRDLARQIGAAMLETTAAMAQEREEPLSELREEITSPRGTTDRGLDSLNEDRFSGIVQLAVVRAIKRAIELSF